MKIEMAKNQGRFEFLITHQGMRDAYAISEDFIDRFSNEDLLKLIVIRIQESFEAFEEEEKNGNTTNREPTYLVRQSPVHTGEAKEG